MNAQFAFHRKNGRYGTLAELVRAGLPVQNLSPGGNGFAHRGYQFEVEAAGDSFRVTATAAGERTTRSWATSRTTSAPGSNS